MEKDRSERRVGSEVIANSELRRKAKENHVPMWQIGMEMSLCEATVQRMLRCDLPDDKRQAVEAAIDRIIERRRDE